MSKFDPNWKPFIFTATDVSGHRDIDIASLVLADYPDGVAAWNGTTYAYRPATGTWQPISKTQIERAARALHGQTVGGRALDIDGGAVTNAYKQASKICQIDDAWLDYVVPGVAFADSFVYFDRDTQTTVAAPHAPAYRATMHLPFDWAALVDGSVDAECPGWIAQLKSTLEPASGDQVEWDRRIKCVEEFAGVALLGQGARLRSALVLLGRGSRGISTGGTGKSQIGEVIAGLFDEKLVANVQPNTLLNPTDAAKLAGKSLVFVDDLDTTPVRKTHAWKAAVTGGKIPAKLLYQDGFDIYPSASHIYCANEIPVIHDNALRERLIIIPCEQKFFRQKNAKLDLAYHVLKEKPAIIARCILAGINALKNGYTRPESSDQEARDSQMEASPWAEFVATRLTPCELIDGATPGEILAAWQMWGGDDSPRTNAQISMRLKSGGFAKDRGRKYKRDGKSISTVFSCRLKTPAEMADE